MRNTRTGPLPEAEGHRGGIDVRVSIRSDAGDGDQGFDGAWFPRSRDLAVEVPELIAALDRHGVRVERFTYALDAWLPAPRKVVVGGRVVRTGGFRSMEPGLGLPDVGRGQQARRPARRPAGDRRRHRRAGAAAVHPARPAPVAADGHGGRARHPAAPGARPPRRLRRRVRPAGRGAEAVPGSWSGSWNSPMALPRTIFSTSSAGTPRKIFSA